MTQETKNILKQTLNLTPELQKQSYDYAVEKLRLIDTNAFITQMFCDYIDFNIIEAMKIYCYIYDKNS